MIPGEEQDEVPWTADAVLEYINSFESPVDAMQNIADTWNYRNEALYNAIANRDAAETEADKLRVERDKLRGLVKALTTFDPYNRTEHSAWCFLCDVEFDTRFTHSSDAYIIVPDHAPDCPWRLAQEYVARIGQEESHV